ncbi:MAG: hypothetical protein ACRCVV_21910 [Shewanella sp.]
MKPFNLEEAKAGKKVVTREGRNVRIVSFNGVSDEFRITAMVDECNREDPKLYTTSGGYLTATEHRFDLFMADEEPESEVRDLQNWCKEILPVVQAAANGEEIEVMVADRWGTKSSVCFNAISKYRIKPKVKVINGFEVPMHETNPPDMDREYYSPSIHTEDCYILFSYYGGKTDLHMLSRGLIYLDKESAIKCAKAMLGIDPEGK